MKNLVFEVTKELKENILPFWMDRMPDRSGGFIGRIDGNGTARPDSERGAILNARILWTFSSAWRILGSAQYKQTAEMAYKYIYNHFIDKQMGGVYWSLAPDGSPKDTKKQFYAIAFTIYALAEFFRAGGDNTALCLAVDLFKSIENHSLDTVNAGYVEACTRNWEPIEDMRLSEKDQNDAKTMNTHLHILEAYTGLYRVWPEKELEHALRYTIDIFLDRIICPNGHLGLFFDEKWNPTSTGFSYGHDIEASWLLCEAADVLGDKELSARVRNVARHMADASMEGFTPEGGMEYEFDPVSGHHNASRDWWVQAETVVGCINQYQLGGGPQWKEMAEREWEFIKKHIICPDGEWYWGVVPSEEGFVANTGDDRAGFWKCPYHNGRMCMEIMERLL